MLKLGSKLDTPKYGNPGFIAPPTPSTIYNTIYEDDFTTSFLSRQVYSSRSSINVSYPGNGTLTLISGASACGALVTFDCLKDKYPLYNNGASYGIGSIVYGGYYGHGLFERTGNPGNPGYPPIISQVGGTQDSSGWTRYRPTTAGRLERDGDGVYITCTFRLNGPAGTAANSSNVLRFGLYDSNVGSQDLPKLINIDNYGNSNTLFGGYASGFGYRGYMMTASGNPANPPSNWKRTTTSSPILLNSTTGIYTQVAVGPQPPAGIVVDQDYSIALQATRIENKVRFESYISGPSIESLLQYEDTNPDTYNFDVFSVHVISNVAASFKLSFMAAESFKKGFIY